MKKILFFILSLGLLSGCELFDFLEGSDDEQPVVGQGITVSVLPNACEQGGAVSRLVVMDPTSCMIEMVDPSAPDVVTMGFWSAEEPSPILVSAVGEQVLFMDYNPCHDKELPGQVLVGYRHEGAIVLKVCTLDADSGELLPTEEEHWVPVQSSDEVRSYSDDDYDEEIRATFFNFLNDLDAGIGDLASKFGPVSKAASAVCSVWQKLAIPSAKLMLYSDDPEKLQEIHDDYMNREIDGWADELYDKFKEIVIPESYQKYVEMAEKGWMAFKYGYENYSPDYTADQLDDYMSAEELGVFNRNSTYASMQASSMRSDIGVPYDKFLVRVTVGSVSDTEARISGSFDCTDGQQSYISEMGFYYWAGNGPEMQVTVSDLYAGTTLRELQPGTQYYVVAYLRSMGEEYYSYPAPFITDFDFSVSPTELSFDAAGGTKGVSVQIPDSGAEWKIARAPAWCKIESGEATFFVTVDAASEKRDGEIVVVCTTASGMTYEEVVAVSQRASGWNYTRWSVSGTVSVAGESSSSTFELAIGDLSKGEITFGGSAPEGFATSASLTANGDLIYKMSQHAQQDGATTSVEVTMCFVRVDHSNLTWNMDFTVTASTSYMGQVYTETLTGKGSGTGVLLDASRSGALVQQNNPWMLLGQLLK